MLHYANLSLSVEHLGTSPVMYLLHNASERLLGCGGLVMYLLHNAPERLLGCGLLWVRQIANDVWQNIVDGIPLQRKLNK